MNFADVILPLALSESFTYSIPLEMRDKIGIGHRVVVSFGERRYYTAIVVQLHNNRPTTFEVKEIHSLLDAQPIVTEHQLELWKWISFYYLSPIGDVFNAAFPSMLKLESDTYIRLISQDIVYEPLTLAEQKIVEYLKNNPISKISDLDKHLELKNSLPFVYALSFKGVVSIEEQVELKYQPKTIATVQINSSVSDPHAVIGKARKQLELYDLIKSFFEEREIDTLPKTKLLKKFDYSNSVLKGLIDKSVLIESQQEISRLEVSVDEVREPYMLNTNQQRAFDEIRQSFEQKNVCLLHGVTSSGKTEIYIHLIEQQLKENRQVLYLVPEIALTTQLTSRLKAVFGNKLGVYHSRISNEERAEIWQKMMSESPYEVIIGARSSLFLPYRQLGLIIVDEEHEASYKQQEPSPRYHGRDTAIMLAHLSQAKVLLGSATPSIESYFNATTGKYGLVALTQRFEDIELPEIVLENTRELRRKKQMKSLLTPQLIAEMSAAIENGEQVILFRNRRGFAPLLECKNCGWTPKCRQCDVSLTLHKFRNELKCHYCGKTYRITTRCEVCDEDSLRELGMGTEKLEEDVKLLFPNAVTRRLDSDTTTSKNAYQEIIGSFEAGVTDILIGTQMLSKGLDFEGVSVVGIISSDGLLSHPDFRSHERGFQLMMQAAGRAGRKHKQGKVIVQAGEPELPVYQYLLNNDYESFFQLQLIERRLFKYPPYTRLISIVFKDKKEQTVENGAQFFARALKQLLEEMVLGPNKPIVGYVKRYHIREILLKLNTGLSSSKVRAFIKDTEIQFRQVKSFKYIMLYYNVDVI